MGIDSQIQQSINTAGNDPQKLQQQYQQSKQLVDLLAMQKLKSEKDAAAKEMQMQQQQQPQTIVEQREAELLGHNKQQLMEQMGPTMNRKGNQMNAAMNKPPGAMPPGAMPPGAMPPGAMPPAGMPPAGGMRPPGQSGIAPAAPPARGMAQGGIVSYASGGAVNTGAELEAEIMKFLQQGARPRDLEQLFKNRPEALAIIRKLAPMPTQGPPTPLGAEFDPTPKVGPQAGPQAAPPMPQAGPQAAQKQTNPGYKWGPMPNQARPAPTPTMPTGPRGPVSTAPTSVPQAAPAIDVTDLSKLLGGKPTKPQPPRPPAAIGPLQGKGNAANPAIGAYEDMMPKTAPAGIANVPFVNKLKAAREKQTRGEGFKYPGHGKGKEALRGASHEFSDYSADAEAEIADTYKRKGLGSAVGQAARSGIGGAIPLAKDAYNNLGVEKLVQGGGNALQQLFTGDSQGKPAPKTGIAAAMSPQAQPPQAQPPQAPQAQQAPQPQQAPQAGGIASQVPQGPQTPSFQNTVKKRLGERSDPARATTREAAARAQRTDDDRFTKAKHESESQERRKMQAHYDRMNDPEYQRKKRLQAFLAGGAGRNSSAAGAAGAAHYNAREEMDKAEEAGIKQIYDMRKQESANAGTMADNVYTAGDTAYTKADEGAGKALDSSTRVMLQEAIDRQNALEAGAQDDYKQGIAIRANMELLTEAQAAKDQWLSSHYPKDYMKYKKNLESAMREGKPEKYQQAKAKLAAMEESVPANIQEQITILTQLVERGRSKLLGDKVQTPSPAPSGKIKPGTLKKVG